MTAVLGVAARRRRRATTCPAARPIRASRGPSRRDPAASGPAGRTDRPARPRPRRLSARRLPRAPGPHPRRPSRGRIPATAAALKAGLRDAVERLDGEGRLPKVSQLLPEALAQADLPGFVEDASSPRSRIARSTASFRPGRCCAAPWTNSTSRGSSGSSTIRIGCSRPSKSAILRAARDEILDRLTSGLSTCLARETMRPPADRDGLIGARAGYAALTCCSRREWPPSAGVRVDGRRPARPDRAGLDRGADRVARAAPVAGRVELGAARRHRPGAIRKALATQQRALELFGSTVTTDTLLVDRNPTGADASAARGPRAPGAGGCRAASARSCTGVRMALPIVNAVGPGRALARAAARRC